MANHCRLSKDSAIAACNAIVDRCDLGTPPGVLIGYTGTEPAYADNTPGTEVFTCTLPNPAFGNAAADDVNGWAEADMAGTATDTSATGNASPVTYFRLVAQNGAIVAQGTLGTSGCDINLNTTTIGAGAQVDITALQVRVPYNQA